MNYRWLIALTLTAGLLGGSALAAPVDIQRHWSGGYANVLLEDGVLTAETDGRFRPDQRATLGTAALGLERLLNPAEPAPVETAPVETAPVETAPAEPAPAPAETGLVSSVGSGQRLPAAPPSSEGQAMAWLAAQGAVDAVQPERPITRGELAQMVYQCWNMGLLPPRAQTTAPTVCTDLENVPQAEAIRFVLALGIFNGRPDGRFGPDETLTRGELAAVLCRVGGLAPQAPEVVLPQRNMITVPYTSQVYPHAAWVGCEPTSLYMALRYRGLLPEMDLPQFLEEMPYDASNPARGFVGSPYHPDKEKKTRTTIYPPVLAEFGHRYSQGVRDFSGSSPAELQAEVLAGNPVVVYVTLMWETPFYRDYLIDGETQHLLSNNHALLLTGYDCATGQYHVTDPYNVDQRDKSAPYTYWVDGAVFDGLYNVRRHAVVVR